MPVPVVLLAVCGYFYTISFDAIERQFYGEYHLC